MRKVYKAKNGAKYVKNPNGQAKFITGANSEYMKKIRNARRKKNRSNRSCASLAPKYQKSCNIYAKTGKIPTKLPKRRHMMLSNIFEKKTNF